MMERLMNITRLNRISIIFLVLILIVNPNTFDWSTRDADATPPPPDDGLDGFQIIDGDWHVYGYQNYTDEIIELNGNLYIHDGAVLKFRNVELRMNTTDKMNIYRIEVLTGGKFYVLDGDDNPSTPGDASNITDSIYDFDNLRMNASDFRYGIFVYQEGYMEVQNSNIREIGHPYTQLDYGIFVSYSTLTLRNVTMSNAYYGVYLYSSLDYEERRLVIDNVTFNRCDYGIFIERSNYVEIKYSVFQNILYTGLFARNAYYINIFNSTFNNISINDYVIELHYAKNAHVAGNSFNRHYRGPYFYRCRDLWFNNNTVENISNYGLHNDAQYYDNYYFYDNQFKNIGYFGMYHQKTYYLNILNNYGKNITSSFIYSQYGRYVEAHGNKAEDLKYYFIESYNDNSAVYANNSANCSKITSNYAVYINTGNTIEFNDNILYKTYHGIQIRTSYNKIKLSNNLIIGRENVINPTIGILLSITGNIQLENNVINNFKYGIYANDASNYLPDNPNRVTEGSIKNCFYSIFLEDISYFDMYNASFNISRMDFSSFATDSVVNVYFAVHVFVHDTEGPVGGALVEVLNGTDDLIAVKNTVETGWARDIYVLNGTYTLTDTTFYSPFNFSAHISGSTGYASQEFEINGWRNIDIYFNENTIPSDPYNLRYEVNYSSVELYWDCYVFDLDSFKVYRNNTSGGWDLVDTVTTPGPGPGQKWLDVDNATKLVEFRYKIHHVDKGLQEGVNNNYIIFNDWVIVDKKTLGNRTVVLNGSLIVESGGDFTLKNITLQMHGTEGVMEKEFIEVRTDGRLTITDGDSDNETTGDMSFVNASKELGNFGINLHPGSEFRFENSWLQNASSPTELLPWANTILVVYDSKVMVMNSTLVVQNYGIMMENTNGSVIFGNDFIDNGSSNFYQGIYLRYSIDILIGFNSFYNTTSQAIYAYQTEDLAIFNNTFECNGGNAIEGGYLTDAYIINNTLKNQNWDAISIYDSKTVIIERNDISNIQSSSVYVYNINELSVSYNTIHDSTSNGNGIIISSCDDIAVAYNNITGLDTSWSTGLRVDYFNTLIVGYNYIQDVERGIELSNWGNENPTGTMHMFNNTVKYGVSQWSEGIEIGGCNDMFIYNNTVDGFNRGITLDSCYRDYVGNNMISNNEHGTAQYGGDGNYYYANVLWGNTYSMFFQWAAIGTVHNTTILDLPPYAIYVNESSEVSLINPFFNLTKIYVSDKTCKVHIHWTFDLLVLDQFGKPQKDIAVRIRNIYGTILGDTYTDASGYVYNVLVNVRTQLYNSNLTYTPHKFEASLGNHHGTLSVAIRSRATQQVQLDNKAPSAYNILINPLTPFTSNDLELYYLFSDPEIDPDNGTIIRWYRNDIYQAGLDNLTSIPYQYTNKGDYWYCKVTPYDGADYGLTTTSQYAFIYNSKPVASGVAIKPDNPSSTEDITVEYVFTDDDSSDVELGTIFRWFMNTDTGYQLKHTTNEPVLNHTRIQKGEVWRVSVEPKDGESSGSEVFSSPTTIGNTPPSIGDVKISPEKPTSTDNLTVEYDFFDIDSDTEAGTMFQWYKTLAGSTEFVPAGINTSTVEFNELTKGETWKCAVTPGDGLNNGETVFSSEVVIDNTAPKISNLKVKPDLAMTDNELYVEYDFFDRDGDNETDTLFEWLKKSEGIYLRTGLKVERLPPLFTTKGDVWVCEVIPFDGFTYGDPVVSSEISIGNSPPVASGLSITPSVPRTLDTLQANYLYSDKNNDDEEGTRIVWYRDGTRVPDLDAQMTVPNSYTSKGEVWYFTVTPSDGFIQGALVTSPEVEVQNSPPEARSPELRNLFPRGDEDLEVKFEFYDPDGDENNDTEILWYMNGVHMEAYDDVKIVPANATEKDQSWYYEIRVFDGTDHSDYNESFPVTVRNAKPVILSYYPEEYRIVMKETETVEFGVEAADMDGDVLFYQWVLENQETGETKTLGEDPVLDLVTDYDSAGLYKLIVTIQDWGINSFKITHEWEVEIKNNNRLPIITVNSPEDDDITMSQDGTVRFSITPSDPDKGESTTVKWLFDGTETGTTGNSYTLDHPGESYVGTHTVTAVVNDSIGESKKTWNVTVEGIDDEADLIYGMTWDQWSVILQVIVIAFTAIFAVIGFLRLRKKKGALQEYMHRIEAPMKHWEEDPDRSEKELMEVAGVIDTDYKEGQIEDLHYFLLSRQVKENLRELRQDRVGTSFAFLPEETQKEIEKMLDDGKITENEYQTFLEILANTPGLTDAQREQIKMQMQQWRMMDKEAEEKKKAMEAFEENKSLNAP